MSELRILILEDVPLDAELMEREMFRSGMKFSSLRVETEEDFKNGILNFQPHLILADHSLPKYDGLSALKMSKKMVPLTPFIFVSGKIGEELSVELMRAGAKDYVFKNNLGKLPTAINRAINEVNEAIERENAIKSLHQSEKRLRLVTDNLQDIILQVDGEGKIVYISRSFEKLLGKDPKDFLHQEIFQFLDMIHPHDLQGHTTATLSIPTLKFNERIEFRILNVNGKPLWMESIANPIFDDDNNIEGIVFVMRDVTARKLVEQELEDHRNNLEKKVAERTVEITRTTDKLLKEIKEREKVEKRLERIINGSPIPTFVIDQQHKLVYWNRALESYTQLCSEDMIGTDQQWMAFYPEKRPCMADLLIEGDEDIISEWYPTKCSRSHLIDGAYEGRDVFNIRGQDRWVQFTATAIHDSNSKVIGAVETLEDITHQVTSKEKISSALAEKEVLLREIHHRVKNNLQIISSLINLQSKRLNDEEVLYIFRKNQNRIHSMAMVHEKLYQSQNLTQINLTEYIQDLVKAIYNSYDLSSSHVGIQIEDNDILIDINTAIPLGLIINELVNNSLKHAFPNTDKGLIRIKFTMDDNRLYLTYCDDGVGLPEDLDVEKSKTLGLKLIKILTEQMNGDMALESGNGAYNPGTIFNLDLEVKGTT